MTAQGPGFGRYQDAAVLSRGERATILRVEDVDLGRPLAVKLPVATDAVGPLLREARTIAQLRHPNVIEVLELGRTDDGTPYYAMPCVEGQSLEALLSAIPARSSVRDGVALLRKVCDAVAFAHSRGVAHGALAAKHVLIGAFGEVVLVGWGAASQAEGVPLDVQPDLAALGGLLARLTRESAAAWELRAIAERAATGGYPAVTDLARDLDAYLAGQAVGAARYSPLGHLALWVRRHRGLVAVLGIVAVLGVPWLVKSLDARQAAARATAVSRTRLVNRYRALADVGRRRALLAGLLTELPHDRAAARCLLALAEVEPDAELKARLGALAGRWTTSSSADPVESLGR